MAEEKKHETYLNENLEQGNNPDDKPRSRTGNKQKNKGRKGSSAMAIRENTGSEGPGSSQRKEDTDVGPLDADLNELPSKRRTSGNNQTGPGLG